MMLFPDNWVRWMRKKLLSFESEALLPATNPMNSCMQEPTFERSEYYGGLGEWLKPAVY